MAAGALISGTGNVAWTFSCENGANLAIITRCYLDPSANTRLLSPQGIFDKLDGNPGKSGEMRRDFIFSIKINQ